MSPALFTTKLLPILIAPKFAPPVTESDVVVAAPAERELREVPPWTVSPVVVAFPKLVLLVTLKAPKLAPPVTDKDVDVAFWKLELPLTVRRMPFVGLFVPIPTDPSPRTKRMEPVALVMLSA